MPIGIELLVIVVLTVANGLFAGAEMAIISLRKSRLQELVAEGRGSAKGVLRLREDPERFLATVQVGITVIGATTAAFGGAALAGPIARGLERAGVGSHSEDIALALVIAIVSYLSLVIGELVPKSLALRSAERYALLVARPLLALSLLARPVVWLLTASSNVVLRIFHDKTNFTEARMSQEELQHVVEAAATAGTVDARAGEIATRALDFGRLRISSLMVPRGEILAIPGHLRGAAECQRALRDATHERLPVFEESKDNIVGYVTTRELVRLLDSESLAIRDVMHAPYFTPEATLAVDVLKEMQKRRTQITFVTDEHGGLSGLVTMEDLVEELVGDIFGEHERPTVSLLREEDGAAVVPGSLPIHEANRDLDIELPESTSYSTVAGLVIAELHRIPTAGTHVTVKGMDLEVVESTARRIVRVRIRRLSAGSEAASR